MTDRLEASERETAALRAQINQAFVSPSYETDLNRTSSSKKSITSTPNSARGPLTANHSRRPSNNDEVAQILSNDGPFSRPLPQVVVNRSKSFQNGLAPLGIGALSMSNLDEGMVVRSHKTHLEQVLRKDAPTGFSDLRIPNYNSIDDILKSNEVSEKKTIERT